MSTDDRRPVAEPDPSASPFAPQETEALPLTRKERLALRAFIEEIACERAALATGD